jgi:hypothetical protein
MIWSHFWKNSTVFLSLSYRATLSRAIEPGRLRYGYAAGGLLYWGIDFYRSSSKIE